MKTQRWWIILAAVILAVATPRLMADDEEGEHEGHGHRGGVTVIHAYGVTPFVYGGSAYVPLKSTTDFLGAALLWDRLRNRATVTYNGRSLGLVIGSPTAYYMGRPVVLPQPPILVNGQVLVPATCFSQYLDVPTRWDDQDNRVMLMGPPGWGYYQVQPYAPPYVVTIIERHGRHTTVYSQAYYGPAPFVYSGVTYIPLRDVTDLIGAALLWDSLRNRATLIYNGRNIVLAVGSPTVYFGPQVVVLPAAPVIVGGQVFVPQAFVERHLRIKVNRGRGHLKMWGPGGREREFRVASAPPGRVSGGPGRAKGWFGRAKVGGPKGHGPAGWTPQQQRGGPSSGFFKQGKGGPKHEGGPPGQAKKGGKGRGGPQGKGRGNGGGGNKD